MIVGVGIDVVDVARFERTLRRTPGLRDRLFTEREAELPLGSLAGRFAAKEALAKALGAPEGMAWRDAEVVNDEGGRPVLTISGSVAARAAQLRAAVTHLSISHDAGIASAVVVLEA